MNNLQNTPISEHGITLRLLRNISGLPQKAMADILQISQPTYSRFESKETELDKEQFDKILEAFSSGVQYSFRLKEKITLLHNNFKQIEKDSELVDNDRKLYLTILEELKLENRELKKLNEEYLERIHKLVGLLEINFNHKL